MNCYLGRPVWRDEPSHSFWGWPDGAVAVVDLRPLSDCALAGVYGDHPWSFVIADDDTDLGKLDDYRLLCSGDPRDARPDAAAIDAWCKITGTAVQGGTFADLLWWHLTYGADPLGLDSCKPLMPGMQRDLELFCGSVHKSEAFRYGEHALTNRVQSILQADFRKVFEESQSGKVHVDLPSKVVDYWCEKYRIDKQDKSAWELLIPSDLRYEIPVLKPHATTYTDDFNRSNGALGASWATWQSAGSAFSISSNTCLANGEDRARYASALSGSDNYAQANCTTTDILLMSRLSTSATSDATWTSYALLLSSNIRTYKVVTGTLTQLASTSYTSSAGTLAQSRSSGSTISTWYGGTQRLSTTDTAVSSGLAGGIGSTNSGVSLDNFETSDLAAAGHPAMRRWGMSRGGIYRPVEIGRQGTQVI